MATVVTFGEVMLRLSPPGFRRFVQTDTYDATFGGGEANVAVSLATFGHNARFVTRLPAHEIGQAAVNRLRGYGVDTRFVARGGDRIGIYFLETGASQRPSKVVYDRAGSAVSQIQPGDVDWDAVMEGADWFHWTGITPALGEQTSAALLEALEAARRHGAVVSCDLNYRKKLWTVGQARAAMNPLMAYVDVCIANEEDADRSLGVHAEGSGAEAAEAGELDMDGYHALARKLMADYDFETVAITLRESFSASDNGWSALILGGSASAAPTETPVRSTRYAIRLVDRVGGGDSFAAGLIHGLLCKPSARDAVEFAAAASCLKQTIPGDLNLTTAEEVEKLAGGSGSGRVER
jgi:2-dehydro-3-deoxygluconokinase